MIWLWARMFSLRFCTFINFEHKYTETTLKLNACILTEANSTIYQGFKLKAIG